MQNGNGITPLSSAAQNGDVGVCKVLLGKGANVNAKDNSGNTALLYAAQNKCKDVCEMLIMFADAETLSTNKELLLRMNDPKINEALEKRQAELQAQNASSNRKMPLTPMLVGKKKTEPSVKPKSHKYSSGSELTHEKKHLNR